MRRTLLSCLILAASGGACAMDDGNLSISGFGTLGAARSDTDKAQFVRYNQAEGVADKVRIGLDSNLGLQASYKINEDLSGTVQVLTRKNTSPTFTTDLTWAFLKYRINDELNARVGRIVIPAFMISDYQNVGYANTMMRPPVELYGQDPIENMDGADFNYQHAFGDDNFTAQGALGVSRGKLFLPSTASVATYRAPAWALAASWEHGPLVLRAAHLVAKLDSNDITALNSLVGTLNAVGFGQLGSDMTVNGGKKIGFTAVGATLDWHNILLQTEYAQRRAKDKVYVPDTNAWYTMLGYRVGKFLPYYSHASITQHGSSITLPAAFPSSGPLSAAVRNLLAVAEQKSDLVGVRWDFAKNVALKLQVDRVKPQTKTGTLIYGPATGLRDTVTVTGVTLDFVF